jgi:hypothetical protein
MRHQGGDKKAAAAGDGMKRCDHFAVREPQHTEELGDGRGGDEDPEAQRPTSLVRCP